MKTTDPKFALTNMNQIYLPINNALSEVGHVHWFLEEIGQGVQHVATRVGDIIGFIQKVNDMRRMTNLGFSFLNIPRSYYGVLDDAALSKACGEGGAARAASIKSELLSAGVIDVNGIVVDLEVTDAAVQAASPGASAAVCAAVKHARYSNLHKLLGDNIASETYLAIVRNKILVDVQGEDLLYQIFTSNVLQREAGMESPFLEFIQRVCADGNKADGTCKVIRPGCGGFGIRNFLTLFLSIEVSKAMNDLEVSESKGDSVGKRFAERRITLFTDQLNESNPILTRISDAMTEEGVLREQAEEARAAGDLARASALTAEADKHMAIKDGGNGLLQECSGKYNGLMKALRQEHAEATAQ
jgi:hypothetical protein